MERSTLFNGKFPYKCSIFHRYVKCPEGKLSIGSLHLKQLETNGKRAPASRQLGVSDPPVWGTCGNTSALACGWSKKTYYIRYYIIYYMYMTYIYIYTQYMIHSILYIILDKLYIIHCILYIIVCIRQNMSYIIYHYIMFFYAHVFFCGNISCTPP